MPQATAQMVGKPLGRNVLLGLDRKPGDESLGRGLALLDGEGLGPPLKYSIEPLMVEAPHFTLPTVSWAAVAAIMPIAIATIPESTAHLYQIDLYVNKLSQQRGGKKYEIANKLGLNLIGDGLGDMVSALFGGPAGTNYGENISTMAITKVFSVPVLIATALLAIVVSFFGKFSAAVNTIPAAVVGGLSVYLFGVIAVQGVSLMVARP